MLPRYFQYSIMIYVIKQENFYESSDFLHRFFKQEKIWLVFVAFLKKIITHQRCHFVIKFLAEKFDYFTTFNESTKSARYVRMLAYVKVGICLILPHVIHKVGMSFWRWQNNRNDSSKWNGIRKGVLKKVVSRE